MVEAGALAGSGQLKRDFKRLVTEQLATVLEHRSMRVAVIGTMLVLASLVELLPAIVGVDTGLMFIVPVVVSAMAGGLREGLVAALVASVLVGLYSTAVIGQTDMALVAGSISARFALYGITAAFLGLWAEAHQSVQMRFKELASKDPLTHVDNIAGFYEKLDLLQRARVCFAVLVIDVDDLKVINDRHGHQAGSAAIRTVANVLKRVVRTSDCVARYGGDEFVVVLKEADRPGAQIVSNRIREMLREETLPGTPGVAVTVSIGAALSGEDGSTSEELLAAADDAMYRDKRTRKNA